MKKLTFLSIIITIFFSSCFRAPDIDYDYATYNRLAGPNGGTITFYTNYSDDTGMYFFDTTSNILVSLDIPVGALDSEMVFNFYQMQNFDVASELSRGLSMVGSKFFYFVPIYASDGYHEHDEADLTYHLSLDFNEPISVTYHYKADPKLNTIDEKKLQFEFYDWINANYKLYKIKIPKIDEWSGFRNIFVQWNQQGYPIGYNENDLQDIILGYWFPQSEGNVIFSSLVNWQEVVDYSIDIDAETISFDIENSDYIYVLSRFIQIANENIPYKVQNFISDNFPSEILRAANIENQLLVVLEDGTIAYFDRSNSFEYAEKYNVPKQQIPNQIKSYVLTNYPNDKMISNSVEYYFGLSLFKINMQSAQTLIFDKTGTEVTYVGSITYDYNFNNLPQVITDHINNNYPNSKINTITNYNSQGYEQITVYLSSNETNVKISFDENYTLEFTTLYGLKIQDIPQEVYDKLNEYFPNIDIVKITKNINTDSSYFQISLLNQAEVEIKPDGKFISISTFVLSSNLPTEVKTALKNNFVSTNIVMCYYDLFNGNEKYSIQYSERLYVEIKPNGTIEFAMSSNFEELPSLAQDYITNNYGQIQFDFFIYEYSDFFTPADYYYYVQLKDDSILFFDKNGNYIDYKNDFKTLNFNELWEQKTKNHNRD